MCKFFSKKAAVLYKNFKSGVHIDEENKTPVIDDTDIGLNCYPIYIDGGLGGYWGEFSLEELQYRLKQAGGKDIIIYVNSPGGDVFETVSICNELDRYKKEHKVKVKVCVIGLAASAAAYLFLRCEKDCRYMMPSTFLMFHRAWNIAMGDYEMFATQSEVLEKMTVDIKNLIVANVNDTYDVSDMDDKLRKELWLNRDECVDIGFINLDSKVDDAVGEDDNNDDTDDMQMQSKWDLDTLAAVSKIISANNLVSEI